MEIVYSKTERESIIQEAVNIAVEKAILLLPEVMANLLQEKVAMRKLADKFYKENAEFEKHKDIVSSTLEQLESDNPGSQYEEVLNKAVPEIKKRIAMLESVDLKTANKPDISNFKSSTSHGEI